MRMLNCICGWIGVFVFCEQFRCIILVFGRRCHFIAYQFVQSRMCHFSGTEEAMNNVMKTACKEDVRE
jgi:hypothetical protein